MKKIITQSILLSLLAFSAQQAKAEQENSVDQATLQLQQWNQQTRIHLEAQIDARLQRDMKQIAQYRETIRLATQDSESAFIRPGRLPLLSAR